MLQEDKRKQLDGIVHKMVQNGESDDNIRTVVNDFKTKYTAQPKKENVVDKALNFFVPKTKKFVENDVGGLLDSLKTGGDVLLANTPLYNQEQKKAAGTRFQDYMKRQSERNKNLGLTTQPKTLSEAFIAPIADPNVRKNIEQTGFEASSYLGDVGGKNAGQKFITGSLTGAESALSRSNNPVDVAIGALTGGVTNTAFYGGEKGFGKLKEKFSPSAVASWLEKNVGEKYAQLYTKVTGHNNLDYAVENKIIDPTKKLDTNIVRTAYDKAKDKSVQVEDKLQKILKDDKYVVNDTSSLFKTIKDNLDSFILDPQIEKASSKVKDAEGYITDLVIKDAKEKGVFNSGMTPDAIMQGKYPVSLSTINEIKRAMGKYYDKSPAYQEIYKTLQQFIENNSDKEAVKALNGEHAILMSLRQNLKDTLESKTLPQLTSGIDTTGIMGAAGAYALGDVLPLPKELKTILKSYPLVYGLRVAGSKPEIQLQTATFLRNMAQKGELPQKVLEKVMPYVNKLAIIKASQSGK